MMIDKGFGLAIGVAALVLLGPAAMAQQPVQQPPPPPAQDASQGGGGRQGFAACKSDLQMLCRDVSGLSARLQCLKTNQDKVSPECMGAIKAVLGVVQAKAATMENAPRPLQACQQDIATLCPDLKAGDNGRMRCLRDNSSKLSPGCASSLKAARQQSQTALAACEADRTRLCGTVANKPADQLKCLKEKVSDLSTDCRKLVEVVRPGKKAAKAEGGAAGSPTGVPGRPAPSQAAAAPAPPNAAAPPSPAAPSAAQAPAAATPRN